jgi:hypothetical protein
MNRKQRRNAEPQKPLGRPGVAIHSTVAGIQTLDGLKFFWFATEDYAHFRAVVSGRVNPLAQELHGPFDTIDAADAAARVAIAGKNCKFEHGGMWDPAWSKPQ